MQTCKENIYKKVEYFLYNYNNIETIIKEIEEDSISYSNVGKDDWLKSVTRNGGNSVELQAIKLANNKKRNEFKKWKVVLDRVLKYLKNYYPEYYKYIYFKYFNKSNVEEIENQLKINKENQLKIKNKVISFITQSVNKANFF